MRIALVATGLGVGGAENQVLALARQFAAKGHEVIVISLLSPLRTEAVDCDAHYLSMEKSLLGLLRALLRFRNLIRAFRPDVVHSHMVHANLFCRLVRLFVAMPVLICSAHSSNEGGRLRMLAYRLSNPLSDVLTNVSGDAARAFERSGARPRQGILVMHNGIDVDHFQFDPELRRATRDKLLIPSNNSLLLAVGRLVPAKDYPTLLRAFALICDRNQNVRLLIAGEGEERTRLEALAVDLGLLGKLSFLGNLNGMQALYCAADLMVMSSRWEGMPLAVLEAMACECVVVATDCGGIVEVLDDPECLVPPADPSSLAKAIMRQLNKGGCERRAAGQGARHFVVMHHAMQDVADRWIRLYHDHSL